MTKVSPKLRNQVAERTNYRCAYCLTDEQIAGVRHTIDHIIPQSLGGQTIVENLCLACWDCNLIKNNRVAGFDPETESLAPLFHPYKQQWTTHFKWQNEGILIIGLTPTGRATINLLKLNRPSLLTSRRFWIDVGWHPPK